MKAKRKTARRSQRQKDVLHTITFFMVTISLIGGLIAYLWIYTEVDETSLALEIQRSVELELMDEIKTLQSEYDNLRRIDVITKKASAELNMVLASPETMAVYIEPAFLTNSYD
jgi:hypothetical protein